MNRLTLIIVSVLALTGCNEGDHSYEWEETVPPVIVEPIEPEPTPEPEPVEPEPEPPIVVEPEPEPKPVLPPKPDPEPEPIEPEPEPEKPIIIEPVEPTPEPEPIPEPVEPEPTEPDACFNCPDNTAPIDDLTGDIGIDFELPNGESDLIDVGLIEPNPLGANWVYVETINNGQLDVYHCLNDDGSVCSVEMQGEHYEMFKAFSAGYVSGGYTYQYTTHTYYPLIDSAFNEDRLNNYYYYREDASLFPVYRWYSAIPDSITLDTTFDESGNAQLTINGITCTGHIDSGLPCDNGSFLSNAFLTPYLDQDTFLYSNVAQIIYDTVTN